MHHVSHVSEVMCFNSCEKYLKKKFQWPLLLALATMNMSKLKIHVVMEITYRTPNLKWSMLCAWYFKVWVCMQHYYQPSDIIPPLEHLCLVHLIHVISICDFWRQWKTSSVGVLQLHLPSTASARVTWVTTVTGTGRTVTPSRADVGSVSSTPTMAVPVTGKDIWKFYYNK